MTEKRENLKHFCIRTFADPVLIYVVIAMMSIMNHYRSSLTLIYGLAAYAVGWIVFQLFDYINKHHLVGFFAYILLFGAFAALAFIAKEEGGKDYPIPFGLWFLTPQSAMPYNKWYVLSIFILFLIFMLSVIYYFTRVRYRLFMNFLILLIPFSIYGKENEEMAIGFIIALCVGFFVLMANFRQLSDTRTSKAVNKLEMYGSAAVFTVIFAIIAAVVPKPYIEADRTMIETVINADALTDKFLKMLEVFRDDTEGEQFRQDLGDLPVYYAVSPMPLHIKTSTFTSYDYEKDSWRTGMCDRTALYDYEAPVEMYYSGEVADAILFAAEYDSEFAEKYGLEPFLKNGMDHIQKQKVIINTVSAGGTSAPVPAGAASLDVTSFKNKFGLTDGGTLLTDGKIFKEREQFVFSAVPDLFFESKKNKELAAHIAAIEDYTQFLDDADTAVIECYDAMEGELYELRDYYWSVLTNNRLQYIKAEKIYMNYGNNPDIYNLAQKITGKYETPYDKALALELYFIKNNFNYDMSYRKEVGENVEDFLFETKRGVCYEYATAMTLLARAAGIPARYCEGFNMQTKYGDEKSQGYIVTTGDAHGFPELYIKGYGWKTFEPTRTTEEMADDDRSVVELMLVAGLIILAISAFALLLIFFMPLIIHKIFLMRVKRRTPNAAVKAVIHRICRVYGISSSSSVHEAEREVSRRSGADISYAALLFERGEYGGSELTEEEKKKAIDVYIAAYNALEEAKKAERKGKRKHKKAA